MAMVNLENGSAGMGQRDGVEAEGWDRVQDGSNEMEMPEDRSRKIEQQLNDIGGDLIAITAHSWPLMAIKWALRGHWWRCNGCSWPLMMIKANEWLLMTVNGQDELLIAPNNF